MVVATAVGVTVEANKSFTGHIVLCGLDELGFRTLEELRRLGEEVVVIAHSPGQSFAAAARGLRATLIEGNYRDEPVLRAAGVASASTLVITEDDDVGNLHAALAAQDLNPNLRIVARMFNAELGMRIQELFVNCAVLSSSAIAAPAFVTAALQGRHEGSIEVAGRLLLLRHGSSRQPGVLLPLARLCDDDTVELLPPDGDDVLCLVDGGTESSRQPGTAADVHRHDPGRRHILPLSVLVSFAELLRSDRRLRWLGVIVTMLASISILVFSVFADLTFIDALYFTVTIFTTTGFGDINLRDAPPGLKLYGTLIMLLGAASLAVLYALITDAIVSARLGRTAGVPRGQRDHVVVCGLGNIGYRVVEGLVRADTPVAAAELDENARFLPAVRRLGVPVVVGDVRLQETLSALNVAEARCLVVATNDDVANLETALHGLALNPEMRVVLRLFDPDLATRVERAFNIHLSRSPSALAAPAFAAAAVSERVLTTIPVGVRVLVVAQARVDAGSRMEGRTVAELEATAEARALMLRDQGRQIWRPPCATVLSAGHELVVVSTHGGLAQVLASLQPGATPAHHPGR